MAIKILDRYLARGVLLQTVSAVTILCTVLAVSNMLRELLPLIIFQNLSVFHAIGFVATAVPFTLPYIVPWSLLVAVQLTFGRLSADNELTAVFASGVSMPRFCLPVFLIGIALSLICLWINCIWAPKAQIRMFDSIVNLALENPGHLFQNNLSSEIFPDRQVFVESVEGNQLKNLQIFEITRDGNLTRVISAKQATVSRANETGAFLLRFQNTRIEERTPLEPGQATKIRQGVYLEEGSYVLPVGRATGADYRKNSLSAQTISQLQEEAKDTSNPRRSAARLEIHRRLSLAMACTAFVLVGIPLAVTARRRETSAGFAISLILAFFYYFFIVVAQAFSTLPIVSIPLLWAPNVAFVIGGLFLYQRLCMR